IQDFGIMALQGYGLTECAPMGALNPDTAPKATSIGTAFPGFGIKIVDKDENGIGEICLFGDNVMMGYYGMPEETAAVIKDGWFHTGDLGYLDSDGYAYITGRKKNVIITKNGKNVFPEELEYLINNTPLVQESMVFEDEKDAGNDTIIIASVTLDNETIEELHGKEISDVEVEKLIWADIDKINNDLPFYKKIKKLIIRKEDFEKSTTKKIKRHIATNKL
ncbi:MAG: AMP-binding protein, partial [Anaerovoracaceae bacterium]